MVQNETYQVLRSFVRDGRPNKLILLHGPNGSAKSTFIRCLGRALEHYSTLDEGALYRFSWIFPAQKSTRGGIGFGGGASRRSSRPTRSRTCPTTRSTRASATSSAIIRCC